MKIVVITGTSSGIGAACAAEFAKHDFKVIGIDMQDPVPGATCTQLFQFHKIDLTSVDTITTFADNLAQSISHVDVLVNCAGTTVTKLFAETTEAEYDKVFNINTKVPFFLSQKLIPLLTKGSYDNRSIVNISSIAVHATAQKKSVYTASKGAMSSLTKAMALELAPYKIRVNVIEPGACDTPLVRADRMWLCNGGKTIEEVLREEAAKFPIGRMGRSEDIARAVYFVADDKNPFMTGSALRVDGGTLCQLPTE